MKIRLTKAQAYDTKKPAWQHAAEKALKRIETQFDDVTTHFRNVVLDTFDTAYGNSLNGGGGIAVMNKADKRNVVEVTMHSCEDWTVKVFVQLI